MKIATVQLISNSPYSQGRNYSEEAIPFLKGENKQDYEKRTWRERCHYNKEGIIYIPCMQFGNALKVAAKYLNIQIPGKGKSTYTKNFESGVLVRENLLLPDKKDTVEGEWVFIPSDGIRGSGKRVWKCFPVIASWKGQVTYYIMDDTITEDVFKAVLMASGNLIGIGRFRPRNWGWYGCFKVIDIQWIVQ
jgi:hypothetical protein